LASHAPTALPATADLPAPPPLARGHEAERAADAGFYLRQALRCRLLAQHSLGAQAAALNTLADKFEREAMELGGVG